MQIFAKNLRLSTLNYWMTSYHQFWFDFMWQLRHDASVKELFKKEFRILQDTFEFIIAIVNVPLSRQDTVFIEAIDISKRMAVALW